MACNTLVSHTSMIPETVASFQRKQATESQYRDVCDTNVFADSHRVPLKNTDEGESLQHETLAFRTQDCLQSCRAVCVFVCPERL